MYRLLSLMFLLLPLVSFADRKADSTWVVKNYTKKEVYITMRDGVRLFTAIYEPRDKKEKHPILINRTPYSIYPYDATFRAFWNNHWMDYCRENYIIVLQDVRGQMMSEGKFQDIRPYNEHKTGKEIDEASDTYDTIDWLVNNVKNNNAHVGVFGSSYPGFYSTMAALSQHPALKAVSPQAPVTDWFIGDDFHHNGAFMLMDAFIFYSFFGKPKHAPTKTWNTNFPYYTKDNYKYYLEAGTLKDIARLFGDSIEFWKELYQHPNYDDWWQVRNTRNHTQHIPSSVATLIIGGLFDAEDCFGAWALYQSIEGKAKNNNRIVMGPWSHGQWYKDLVGSHLGNVRFGSNTSEYYRAKFEAPFFNYHLKGKGDISHIKEANVFMTGANEWRTYSTWPPADMKKRSIYLQGDGSLSYSKPISGTDYSRYTSDPSRPVPYTEDVHHKRTSEYMTDDQRFAARRPDVLVFETEPLSEDMTLTGPVIADLYPAISTADADFIVKLIDVFPDDFIYDEGIKGNNKNYPMGGYQMLVRGEVMRGRYRNSFEHPEAFEPGEVTQVRYTLPDVSHTFKKGHRLMIQVQSSWFPLVDRNPQQFINIYKANKQDFIKSNIRIYHDAKHPSRIILPVLSK